MSTSQLSFRTLIRKVVSQHSIFTQKATLNKLSHIYIENRLTRVLIREIEIYSSSSMRFLFFSHKFDEISSQQDLRVVLSSLMSRFIKFDKPLSLSLMSRFQFDKTSFSESCHRNVARHNRGLTYVTRKVENEHA